MTLQAASATCAEGPSPAIDLAHARWKRFGLEALYEWDTSTCGHTSCAKLQRRPLDTELVPDRDKLDADLGNGVWIHLPLAVWADANRTLPVPPSLPIFHEFAITDLPIRLAAVSAAWGTLSLFYPYFEDQRINWLTHLPHAFQEVAAARLTEDVHVALAHLIAQLRDNHARVTHPAASVAGVLPIALRRFDDKIAVIGGLSDYMKSITAGDELVNIEGTAAIEAYDRAAAQVSAATEGLRTYLAPIRMTLGAIGTFLRIRIRHGDGKETEHVLPRVSRDLHIHAIRDPRPKPGDQLAPGVYYIDFDEFPLAEWKKLLPTLQNARALVFDFRGYTRGAGFAALAHITDRELKSPFWHVPSVTGRTISDYLTSQWSIYPQRPRLHAKVIVLADGQSMSAVETILQMFRDHHLGLVVGETSGGTNGTVATFRIPGGFEVRFTGMRVADASGSTIQGRGITPDIVVHPTLKGVRAGRDEILEAGVAAAQRP